MTIDYRACDTPLSVRDAEDMWQYIQYAYSVAVVLSQLNEAADNYSNNHGRDDLPVHGVQDLRGARRRPGRSLRSGRRLLRLRVRP